MPDMQQIMPLSPFRSDFLTDTSDFLRELTKFVHLSLVSDQNVIEGAEETYHCVNDFLELDHDDTLDGNRNLL